MALLAVHFTIGFLFGLGLVISRLADPQVVTGFLDITGMWDPSLLLTMAGGVAVAFAGYRMTLRRPAPLLADRCHLPTATKLDRRLIVGAVVFGAGWGLAGVCPGPAIVWVGLMAPSILLFLPAMFTGMLLSRYLERGKARR